MEMLVSGDVNAVHGAMRVLTGIEPTKYELLSIGSFIFSIDLYNILYSLVHFESTYYFSNIMFK